MLLPLFALGLSARLVALMLSPDRLPVWAALLVGLVMGLIALVALTAISGTDLSDLMVTSVYIIIGILILTPVMLRAQQNAKIHQMERQLKEKQVTQDKGGRDLRFRPKQ